ncbi:unnamed protein product, partial [Scytosiphon promiscuus]
PHYRIRDTLSAREGAGLLFHNALSDLSRKSEKSTGKMAMFPQFGAMPGAPAQGGSAPLLSFKAGKMKVTDKGDNKFHITPDLRKGTISLFKGPDDQLMHFAWKERPSGTVVDDVIILPEEAVYKKIDTGREGERVFLMEIAGNRRFFYWMQDKDVEKDEENMKKVNELTNSPPPDDAPSARGGANTDMMELLSSMGGGSGASGMGATAGASAAGGAPTEQGLNIQNLQSILQNMGFSPQEQAQATGAAPPASAPSDTPATAAADSAAPSTPAAAAPAAAETETEAPAPAPAAVAAATPAAAAATPAPAGDSGGGGSGGGLTAADLQRAMMNISGMVPQQRRPPISLNDVVDADAIERMGILDDPEVQAMLLPLLPEARQTEEELRETIRSPQLQQSLASLSRALQSDNFNNIMSSFELDPSNPASAEAMARGDPVDAFLQALMHAATLKNERDAVEKATIEEGKGGEKG